MAISLPEAELNRYIEAAYAAGCPRDQVERFLRAGYIATPKQLEFHAYARKMDSRDNPNMLLIGGARGGAKSHGIFAQMGIDDCQRVKGLKCLFLRQIQKSASESFYDLSKKVLYGLPHDFKNDMITLPNESRIITGGYHDDRDIAKYLGIEYDMIAVEERTQLSGDKLEMLDGSLRTSKTDWRTRHYDSTNPGGIGHAECKKDYIDPYRKGKETNRHFIPMSYKDNPFLDVDYIKWLENLRGPLGKAWRDGDWDVFEGMAFSQWNEDIHVIEDVELQPDWTYWVGIDWGYSAPLCILFMACNPINKRVYVYDEIYIVGIDDVKQAYMVIEKQIHYRNYLDYQNMTFTNYGDPSMWGKKTAGNVVTTTFDTYQTVGLTIIKGDNDRLNGKRKIDSLLGLLPDGIPGLQITRKCKNLIRTLPLLIYDKDKPEDVDCFVKGTKVSTPKGNVNVENIKAGDLVDTPIGARKVIKAGVSGKSERVVEVLLSNGDKLKGTANHCICVVGKGLVELQKLQPGNILTDKTMSNIILEWKIKRLFTKVSYLEEVLEKIIIGQTGLVLRAVFKNCIEKYLRIILEKFQKTIVSTTKTMISTIMNHLIWKLCIRAIMPDCTIKLMQTTKRLEKNYTNGIIQKKVKNNCKIMQKGCATIRRKENYSADIVEYILKRNIMDNYTVQKNVKNGMSILRNVLSAVKKKLGKVQPVHIVAVGNYEEETVYRLTVEEAHLYYANGFLVTNTNQEDHAFDALKYGLTAYRFMSYVKPTVKPAQSKASIWYGTRKVSYG